METGCTLSTHLQFKQFDLIQCLRKGLIVEELKNGLPIKQQGLNYPLLLHPNKTVQRINY